MTQTPGVIDWQCTVQQVADIMVARTSVGMSGESGTFSANTRPTDTQVGRLITSTAADVAEIIGVDIPDSQVAAAQDVVAYGTAAKVELAFFAEQVKAGTSPYQFYLSEYESLLSRAARAIEDINAGGDVDGVNKQGYAQGFFGDSYAANNSQQQFPGWGTKW